MSKFGKYEVLEKIGVGGFGVVYRAFDPHIKRLVAIKTCTTDDQEVRARFFHEAEIAGNLQHRNVVTVYDFGIQEEVPYLVQEYLSGEDLDDKIKRKSELPADDRISWLLQIARGLEFAHSKGVVHRDIKPANIRILEDGTAKIMDFGIAKLAQRHTGLTQTGMTLGTAAYLAPEQIRGEPVDPRTDIFSFGALAYELLTFKKAFEGETISTVLYQILHKDPPAVRESWSDAPAAATQIVARCLAKDAAERFATTGDLVAALDQLLQSMRAPKRLGPTQVIDTSGMPTTALGTLRSADPSAAPAKASPGTAADATPALDLAFRREGDTGSTTAHRAASRDGGAGRWVAVGSVVLALAGGVAWYILRPGTGIAPAAANPPVAAAAPPVTTAPPTPPPPAPEEAQAAAAEPVAGGGEPVAVATPPSGGAPAPSAPASGAPSAKPPVAPTPAPPAAPKPPAKGRLTLPPAWDPRATITIDGGPARTLDRETKLELEPGAHELVFELLTAEFSDRKAARLEIAAGESRTLAIPLEPPGQLTIQPALGGPLGVVRLDGEDLGQSPVRGRVAASGTHRLEIVPLQGGDPIVAEVAVKPGTLTTVTFDLAKGAILNLHDRPLGGS